VLRIFGPWAELLRMPAVLIGPMLRSRLRRNNARWALREWLQFARIRVLRSSTVGQL
jgi:hypothetical protein